MESLRRKERDGRAALAAGLATGGLAFILCLGVLCWATPGVTWWVALLSVVPLLCGVVGAEAERWPLIPPARPDDSPEWFAAGDAGEFST